jgi:putative transposase
LGQAVEAEVAALLSSHADKLTDDGRQRLVRHGHLPAREIMTGIGPVAVRCPRVRDRVGKGGERIRFSSAILPPYARRSKSLEVLISILYLKGISTGDFEEALIALLGKDADGLSASTIGRLKEAWSDEHTRWSKRDLSAKRYVYFWVDGIHVQARLEEAAQCLLVIIGADQPTLPDRDTPVSQAESLTLAGSGRAHFAIFLFGFGIALTLAWTIFLTWQAAAIVVNVVM